ncbi:unnamed protein product [Moneuplotes crassus]|uniref:Uncharacterized protein n=1 Tax=Euplotes crassus TaxID=5936 RepID=A0AAD1XEE7_EUPCR|nr:unnamed protein product [Moneuplotes crassus]
MFDTERLMKEENGFETELDEKITVLENTMNYEQLKPDDFNKVIDYVKPDTSALYSDMVGNSEDICSELDCISASEVDLKAEDILNILGSKNVEKKQEGDSPAVQFHFDTNIDGVIGAILKVNKKEEEKPKVMKKSSIRYANFIALDIYPVQMRIYSKFKFKKTRGSFKMKIPKTLLNVMRDLLKQNEGSFLKIIIKEFSATPEFVVYQRKAEIADELKTIISDVSPGINFACDEKDEEEKEPEPGRTLKRKKVL